jgi:hypothetical protein
VIEARAQLSFGDGLIAEEVTDLWEDWMRSAHWLQRPGARDDLFNTIRKSVDLMT